MSKRLSLAGLILCLTSLPFIRATAQNWMATKLNTFAVTNASGAIAVLGTDTNAWTSGMTKEAVYDGNTNTYFDCYQTNNAWSGFQLQSPKIVTRIRYCGRTGQEARMVGARFEGADNAAFTNAVTIWTHTPPNGWGGDTWIDVSVTNAIFLPSFSYLRFIATATPSFGGNVREVEFYGVDPITNGAPALPAISYADSANWYAHLRWTVVSNTMAYEVQRKLADESAFSTVLNAYYNNVGLYTWRDPQPIYADTQYRIRARSTAGDSDWFTFTAAARNVATGTLFGVAGSYMNNGQTFIKLFDANIDSFFDGPDASSGNNLWGAIDLGQTRTINGIRYVPRRDFPTRMPGGMFQAADNTNFTGAVTLNTILATPPITNTTEVVLASPVSYRYVRYMSPNGGWGNAAEIEFDLAPAAPQAPIGLAATSTDITNDYPILTWSYPSFTVVASSGVYRATAPGGPYTALTPEGINGRTLTDTNLTVGVLYYYKVSALCTNSGGGVLESPLSAYVTYRRCARIEREWGATAVKSGMTPFRIGVTYGADPNSPGIDVPKMFDNSLSTFPDIIPSACIVGVDLGKPYGVGKMRFSPRTAYPGRVNGAVLRGSNEVTTATTLATFANGAANAYTLQSTTSSDSFRYVFATRLDSAEFYGNIAELELYGWSADSLTNVLLAPMSMAFTIQPGSFGVCWAAGTNATSYRLERMPADGSTGWGTIGTSSTTNLNDSTAVSGVRYLYRAASLRTTESGVETAYSESFPAVTYSPGSGTGLKGSYTANYTKAYRADEALVLVQTNATLDLTWASGTPLIPGVASSISNVLIVWSGKLVVPHAGTYLFYTTSDDGAALRLDGQFVINDWVGHTAGLSTGTVTLAAGQHDIRVDYFQQTSGGAMRLEWDGAVTRGVIPASQLIPGDLASDDIGAWKGRTFNTPKLGYHAYDSMNAAITVASAGLDLSGAVDGHHFVWQQLGGSFLLEAKVYQTVDPASLSAKALLMARNTIATGSAFLAPTRMATGQLGCKGRTAAGGNIADMMSPAWQGAPTNPCWMRLKRAGNTFTGQYKNSGGAWTTFYTFVDSNAVFNASMCVGFSVTSPSYSTAFPLQSATFSEIRLVRLTGTTILVW